MLGKLFLLYLLGAMAGGWIWFGVHLISRGAKLVGILCLAVALAVGVIVVM